jgi:Hint domain
MITSGQRIREIQAMAIDLPLGGDLDCFCRGTLITTPQGAVAIEDLFLGQLILTASGEARSVRWIGHRGLQRSRHPDPALVWPICVRAGAVAENMPSRDLWLSPGHAIFVDGVLIPAASLVNGATIFQVRPEQVEYWHLQLDSHDIVIAEGLPAESLLDTDLRTTFFGDGAISAEALPDSISRGTGETCAPLVTEGPKLQGVRAALLERAQGMGHTITGDPDLHVLADDQRIEPLHLNNRRVAFTLPPATRIELCSRGFEPRNTVPDSTDTRRLGVNVERLQLDGSDVPLRDDAVLSAGWHTFEANPDGFQWRWSSDRATLPSGTRLIVLDYTPGRYWAVDPPLL